MRRKDKEIGARSEIDAVIGRCSVCHLAMALDNQPYVVPLSFGYDGRCLYFHTAVAGRKLDFLQANPQVCFQMECGVTLHAGQASPCKWSFAFESVIGFGRVRELTDPAEKMSGLMQIVSHYAPAAETPRENEIKAVKVWCIEIDALTAKRSQP